MTIVYLVCLVLTDGRALAWSDHQVHARGHIGGPSVALLGEPGHGGGGAGFLGLAGERRMCPRIRSGLASGWDDYALAELDSSTSSATSCSYVGRSSG